MCAEAEGAMLTAEHFLRDGGQLDGRGHDAGSQLEGMLQLFCSALALPCHVME